MPEPVTYNLVPPTNTADFYNDLCLFTDEVLVVANIRLGSFADDYYNYITGRKVESPRNKNEYLLEIVISGVLIKNYYAKAQKTNSLATRLLGWLYDVRKQNEKWKPAIDKLRGVLSYQWLNTTPATNFHYSFDGVGRLLDWLSATGEFKEEVIRLRQWIGFLKPRGREYFRSLVTSSIAFTEYFERNGEEKLGKYVCNVNHFLQNRLATYRFKEDYFFVSRTRNEYFTNMFGAEVMNRCMETGFKKMPNKAVLLPTCMRTPPAGGCLARHDGKEMVCMQCNRDCNVGKVATAVKKHGVKCYLIPHSSGFSRFLRKWANNTDTGLVGVTCILNLLTGGYEMKRLNISSQCIFLDYCGCKKHWDKEGTPTKLNIQQLIEIVS